MSSPDDRFTATLSQLRPREFADRRPGRLSLCVADDSGTRELSVQGPRITGGAHPDNQIVVVDETMSAVHFELAVHERGVALRDLGSKNGTWVSPGVRVAEVWLQPGASFRAGGCSVTLVGLDDVAVPIATTGRFGEFRGRSAKMGELFARLQRLAELPLDVLLIGETGTGKELVARGLHAESPRSSGPFVVVDCTNLAESIAESTLLGHRKGAFTGAASDQPGLLEIADGGTLFIDEIGELPASLQPKLLRALDRHETRRVGETDFRRFDARVVAATNRDLHAMVNEGTFRADLYFRLAQMRVDLPPLRERGKADIALLADLFVAQCAAERGVRLQLERPVYEALARHAWPGNVRELRNVIRCAAMWSPGELITAADLPPLGEPPPSATADERQRLQHALTQPIADARNAFDRVYVTRIIADVDGNQSEAARRIGMSRSAFRELLKRLGL